MIVSIALFVLAFVLLAIVNIELLSERCVFPIWIFLPALILGPWLLIYAVAR